MTLFLKAPGRPLPWPVVEEFMLGAQGEQIAELLAGQVVSMRNDEGRFV